MSLESWESKMERALREDAHQEERQRLRRSFSPELSFGRHFGPSTSVTKSAAVMILLEPHTDHGWSIPLTARPEHLPDHPGQISFPGGRLEGNESFQDAAEREFMEELGPESFKGRVLGELSPIYVFNSDYFVRPFVAACDSPHAYQPCEHEVARIVDLPVTTLCDPQAQVQREYERGQIRWNARAIRTGDDHIWGATAMMLGELAAVLAAIEHPAIGTHRLTQPGTR